MRIYATISADIVASTSLSRDSLIKLTQQIKELLGQFSSKYDGFWGRLVHGDSIECVMNNPNDALRIAVLLKTCVKSSVPIDGEADNKFRRIGLRLAIGIGRMCIIDKRLDIMDGEAIYLSVRALAKMREKPTDNFQIEVAPVVGYDKGMAVIVQFISRIIDEATSRQCKTLFYRLQCDTDNDVANIMGISRAGVNNNLRCLGWNLITNSISYFEEYHFI